MKSNTNIYTNEKEELAFYRSFIESMNGVLYVLKVYPTQIEWISNNEVLRNILGLDEKDVIRFKTKLKNCLIDSPDYEESASLSVKKFTQNPDIKWAGVYRIKNSEGEHQWTIYSAATISKDQYGLPDKIAVIALPLNDVFNTPKAITELQKHLSQQIHKKTIDSLTQKQMEVFKLIAHGYIRKEIAHKLNISEYTVESHKEALYKKLNCSNKTELIKCAEKFGLF